MQDDRSWRESAGSASQQLRTSVKWPVTAAAAAMAGLTRWVRPPGPCRPSKLRLLVLAERWPGVSLSGFIARHMLQPACRHSAPASVKTRSSPSASAWWRTCSLPGTTRARTPGATLRPWKTCGRGAQVLDPAVGARADEDDVDRDLGDRRAGRQAHVVERPAGVLAAGEGDVRRGRGRGR